MKQKGNGSKLESNSRGPKISNSTSSRHPLQTSFADAYQSQSRPVSQNKNARNAWQLGDIISPNDMIHS